MQGEYSFSPVTNVLTWEVGKVQPGRPPQLRGILSLQTGIPAPEEKPVLNVSFKMQQVAVSGVRISRLDMSNERYKPFKGVKYVTKAGKFQVRT